MSFEGICRTCLGASEVMYSLFDMNLPRMEAAQHTCADFLKLFTSVQIDDNDLPEHICITCSKEIQRIYSFKLKCEKSENVLQQLKEVNLSKPRDSSNQYEIDCENTSEFQNDTEEDNIHDFDYPNAIVNQSPSSQFVSVKEEYAPDYQNSEMYNYSIEKIDTDCDEKKFNTDEQLVCSDCTKEFDSTEIFYEHIVTDHMEGNLCYLCDKVFQCGQLEHAAKHLPSSCEDIVALEGPPEVGNVSVKSLEANNTGELFSYEEYQCSDCSKIFRCKNALIGHLCCAAENKEFQCKLCSLNFRYKHSLKKHILKKHSNEKPIYERGMCPRINFKDIPVSKVHDSKKLFQCELCFEKFRYSYSLKTHVERKHTNNVTTDDNSNNYECTICLKSFSRNSFLASHMRLHTGEKPFECKFCSETFAFSKSLKFHIQLEHRNELTDGKPEFQCSECNKFFGRKCELIVHMRLHTGEKPFKCENCFISFRHKSTLTNHVRARHPADL